METDRDTAIMPLNPDDLNTEMGPEPRIQDLRLADALGFERPRKVRELIERNLDELQEYGNVMGALVGTTERGGRPTQEYWLNEGQALLICMFSRTEQAALVRRQVIRLYLDWKHGRELPPPPRRSGRDDLTAYLGGPGEISVESLQNRVAYWRNQRDFAQERLDALLERFPLLNRPRR